MMYDQREQTISRSSILYGTRNDDAWFNLDQFYKDQLKEVNEKLAHLDDEIWGKILLMEKNKRIAKAYLRTPRFRVDGSCQEFDGQRIGFKSLPNLSNDAEVEEIREKIGVVLLKMDQQGNILAKRCEGSSPVIVQGWRSDACCHGTEVTKMRGRLEPEKPSRIFDMRLFKASIEAELRQAYPDRKKLLYKSAVRVSLVKDESHPFKTPCWFMLINLVALDMLNANVPAVFPGPPSGCSPNSSTMPRCQSVSSDLHLSSNRMSLSSNELYFSPATMQSSSSLYSDSRSAVWSDVYEDPGAPEPTASSTSPTDQLSAQLANNLALGWRDYSTLAKPLWSTSMARSMDCLYGTAPDPSLTASTAAIQQGCHQKMEISVAPSDRALVGRQNKRRQSNCNTHCQQFTDAMIASAKEKHIYAIVARPTLANAVSDSESSSTSGGGISQQQDIYEPSSTHSSNSSSGVSCRPSSPSVASESASDLHSVNSVGHSTKGNDTMSNHCQGSTTLASGRSAIAVSEPSPRPRSLFKNAIRSKLQGLNVRKGADTVLETKRAILARYNNVKLDNEVSPLEEHCASQSNWRHGPPIYQSSPEFIHRLRPDSREEIYRL